MTVQISVFTGHRDIVDGHSSVISSAVQNIMGDRDRFVVGGARGADTLVLNVLCDAIQAGQKCARPVIMLPDYIWSMPAEARVAVDRAKEVADPIIIELGLGYSGEALKERNVEMLRYARDNGIPSLVAYWSGLYKSGTYSAICSARRMKMPVFDILQNRWM